MITRARALAQPPRTRPAGHNYDRYVLSIRPVAFVSPTRDSRSIITQRPAFHRPTPVRACCGSIVSMFRNAYRPNPTEFFWAVWRLFSKKKKRYNRPARSVRTFRGRVVAKTHDGRGTFRPHSNAVTAARVRYVLRTTRKIVKNAH